jgi:gamma-glutamylcyclotransferase (GGCT)/AIG2-like uncharacterized protein YtfP
LAERENTPKTMAYGANVRGQIFEVTPEELKKLDENEDRYHRHKVTLRSGREAWVYRLRAGQRAT